MSARMFAPSDEMLAPFIAGRQAAPAGWRVYLSEKLSAIRGAPREQVFTRLTHLCSSIMLVGCISASVYLLSWGNKKSRCIPGMDDPILKILLAGMPLFGVFVPITFLFAMHVADEAAPVCLPGTVTMLLVVMMVGLAIWCSFCFSAVGGKILLMLLVLSITLIVLFWAGFVQRAINNALAVWRRRRQNGIGNTLA